MPDKNTSPDDKSVSETGSEAGNKASSAPLLNNAANQSEALQTDAGNGRTANDSENNNESADPSSPNDRAAGNDAGIDNSRRSENIEANAGAASDESDRAADAAVADQAESQIKSQIQGGRWKRFGRAYWRRRLWTLPLTVVLLAAVVLAVPAVRYPAFATFMQKDVTIMLPTQALSNQLPALS